MTLQDRLKQIKSRIVELQRKAEAIELELNPIPSTEETITEAPRRRGRRKLNETEQ